jgi:hypothetical protein
MMKKFKELDRVRQSLVAAMGLAIVIACASAVSYQVESGTADVVDALGVPQGASEAILELANPVVLLDQGIAPEASESVVDRVTYDDVLQSFYGYPATTTKEEFAAVMDTYHAQRLQILADEAALASAAYSALPWYKKITTKKGD